MSRFEPVLPPRHIISEPFRAHPSATVLEMMENYGGEWDIATPVWQELWFGWARLEESRKRTALGSYLRGLSGLEIIPYDNRAARWHASERGRLVSEGLTPPFVDGQIAAIARVNGLTLVTRNVIDFERYDGLVVENWFDS